MLISICAYSSLLFLVAEGQGLIPDHGGQGLGIEEDQEISDRVPETEVIKARGGPVPETEAGDHVPGTEARDRVPGTEARDRVPGTEARDRVLEIEDHVPRTEARDRVPGTEARDRVLEIEDHVPRTEARDRVPETEVEGPHTGIDHALLEEVILNESKKKRSLTFKFVMCV